MSGLAFKEPSEGELKKAMAHIDELLADPVKFDELADLDLILEVKGKLKD